MAHLAANFINGYDIELKIPHMSSSNDKKNKKSNKNNAKNSDNLQCIDIGSEKSDEKNDELHVDTGLGKNSQNSNNFYHDELEILSQNFVDNKIMKKNNQQTRKKLAILKNGKGSNVDHDLIAGFSPQIDDVVVEETSQNNECKSQFEFLSEENQKIIIWVEVQQQMFRESRLSPEQIKYLAALGLSWILSEEIMNMSDAFWASQFQQLKTQIQNKTKQKNLNFQTLKSILDDDLFQFYVRQIGLRRLNFLQHSRIRKFDDLGISWEIFRDENDEQWDYFISSLMEYKRVFGSCDVDQQNDDQLWQQLNKYKQQLQQQRKLSGIQVLQLKALGIGNAK
eukprot:TRINITY_DN4146_c0_g2_i1.p1 TRINITY_DN4146_c0_g2~~TRINITY_DN4146_c0_g2_i1.p1  ORF type:complete len:397 (+),score=84.33 TRINITY_DN4146_c0_g2_i1:180-1193(+)